MVFQVLLLDIEGSLEVHQFLLRCLKHLVVAQDAATVRFGQLFDHTNNSCCDLALRSVDLLHLSSRLRCLLFLLGSCDLLRNNCGGVLVQPLVSRDVLVVFDPVRFWQDFNCYDVGINGPVLMLERLNEEL